MESAIESKIRQHFTVTQFVLQDQSGGCGQAFRLVVVADEFDGMPLLERQQKVNEVLAEEISHIHALELKTWTAKQWDTKKDTL